VYRPTLLACCLLLAAFCLLSASPAADWPGWRGPDGAGVSAERALPTEWSASRHVRWKVPLAGAGVSAPVVSGGRVFLTPSRLLMQAVATGFAASCRLDLLANMAKRGPPLAGSSGCPKPHLRMPLRQPRGGVPMSLTNISFF